MRCPSGLLTDLLALEGRLVQLDYRVDDGHAAMPSFLGVCSFHPDIAQSIPKACRSTKIPLLEFYYVVC